MLGARPVSVDSLAFIGPAHVPTLTAYTYVRVRSVERQTATVQPVGPDTVDDEEFEVPVATLEHRLVEDAEGEWWPGSYVGVPVAFVQLRGRDAGLWSYGVVSSYRMGSSGPVLEILSGDDMAPFPLAEDPRIIKVDYLNYALQLGVGTSVSVTNPGELLQQQNKVCVACAKRRDSLPEAVVKMLPERFDPSDVILLIRPNTLERVHVRKQHIINMALQSSKKRVGSVFDEPAATAPTPAARLSTATTPAESDDEAGDDDASSRTVAEDTDLEAVRLQNKTLGKRRRRLSSGSSAADSVTFVDARPSRGSRGTFQPSPMQRQAHNLVVHRRHQGTDAHSLLEFSQRSGHASLFLATPPVLRGLYDLGFGERGLDVMHCKRATMPDKIAARDKGINMTDFSEKNVLRAASKATCRSDVADALRVLTVFARFFYNKEVNNVVDAASAFVDTYTGLDDHDAIGWNHISFWISQKIGKFSCLLMCDEEPAALAVASEFTRYDEGLAQLNDLRLRQRPTVSPAPARTAGDSARRSDRPPRPNAIPISVVTSLPRQGGKRACLKFLSKVGCSNAPGGGCFDPNRAHFIPNIGDLSAEAKTIIHDRYQGLSAAAANL